MKKMTTAKCKARNRNGQRCGAKPLRAGEYCFIHDPASGEARAKARRKGGENRHTPHFADPSILPANVRTLEEAHALLTYTLQEVAGMDNTTGRARVLLALFDSFIRSIEGGELEKRITTLEAMLRK